MKEQSINKSEITITITKILTLLSKHTNQYDRDKFIDTIIKNGIMLNKNFHKASEVKACKYKSDLEIVNRNETKVLSQWRTFIKEK